MSQILPQWRGGGGIRWPIVISDWWHLVRPHDVTSPEWHTIIEIHHCALFVTRVQWGPVSSGVGGALGCWLWVRVSCLKMRYYKALVSAILTNALSSTQFSKAKAPTHPISISPPLLSTQWMRTVDLRICHKPKIFNWAEMDVTLWQFNRWRFKQLHSFYLLKF